jgi:hypothetical protein
VEERSLVKLVQEQQQMVTQLSNSTLGDAEL